MATEKKKKKAEPQVRQRKRHMPLLRVLVVFSIIIVVLNVGVLVKRGMDNYHEALTEAQYNNAQLAHMLSDHVSLTFLAVDQVLKRAAERQYFNTLFGENLQGDVHNSFRTWVTETPQVAAMLLTDEQGQIQMIFRKQGYKTWMEGKENIAEQDYFRIHQEGNGTDILYVGRHSSWLQDHKDFVVMSRSIHNVDGSFGGVILAAVNVEYLLDFFRKVEGTDAARFVLLRNDMRPLVSEADDISEFALLTDIIRREKILTPDQNVTTHLDKTSPDSKLRIISFNNLAHMYMTLAVLTDGDSALALWKQERWTDVLFLSIFVAFILVVAFFVLSLERHMRRAQRSESSALLASQAKSDFLASMSHELRTPLNAIIGFSEMLEAGYFGQVNAKQKERVHDIHYCGTHLLELINDILDFSKGEAGKMELYIENVSISRLIKETTRIFADRSRKDEVNIICDVLDDLPAITVDKRKMKQILINLLSNAVKFTEANGTVEISAFIDDRKQFVLTVTDTGVGMAEEDIPKALSAFGQVHTDPIHGGTGLGLPLCKMLTELHGGELQVQSIKGVGTKISVILPSARVIWSSAAIENSATAPAVINNVAESIIENNDNNAISNDVPVVSEEKSFTEVDKELNNT